MAFHEIFKANSLFNTNTFDNKWLRHEPLQQKSFFNAHLYAVDKSDIKIMVSEKEMKVFASLQSKFCAPNQINRKT